MIEARALHKRFGSVEAVRDLSFAARDGRITGLLGPNGAGKSTTLRLLGTLLRPDAGTALIDGIDASADALEARRRIGVLSHASGLYPHLNAIENVLYFGELQGLARAVRERRAEELVELLEMREFALRHAKGYSQGQRLKTALARALIHSPRNLMLDEPTNGLDVMAVRNLRALLLRLKQDGHCVLFSSHVMQEVGALCDDIVVIAHGTVAAAGTPEQIRARGRSDQLEEAFVRLIGTAEGLN